MRDDSGHHTEARDDQSAPASSVPIEAIEEFLSHIEDEVAELHHDINEAHQSGRILNIGSRQPS